MPVPRLMSNHPRGSAHFTRGIFMKAARAVTARVVGLGAAVVASLVTGVPAQAVTSSQPATSSTYGFAAKLQIGPVDAGGVSCSGALVGARYVLTAKSCFGVAVAAGVPPKVTTVTVGRPDLTQPTGHVLVATELVPHPDRDLVLVRLAADVPAAVRPIGLAAATPAAGSQVTVTGFGRTATEWVPSQLHAAAFRVDSVNSSVLAVTATNGASTCKGDAGGAVLAGGSLAAINGNSWQKGCLGSASTTDGAEAIRVDGLQGWVDAQVKPRGNVEFAKNNSTGYCLAVGAAAKAVDTPIVQWYCNDGVDHRWIQRATADSYLELYNANSGLCAGVGTATGNGAPLQQKACGGHGEQWAVELMPGNTVRYRNRLSGQCVAIPGNSNVAGRGVIQWPCDFNGVPRADQMWKMLSRDSGGRHLRNNHTDLCLAVGGSSRNDGATALQWNCRDNDDQRWNYYPAAADGSVTVKNINSGKCLSINNNTADGVLIAQYTCDGGNDQRWKIETLTVGGEPVARFRNVHSNKCLAIRAGATARATPAIQWPCNNSADHNWIR